MWSVENMNLLTIQFCHVFCYSLSACCLGLDAEGWGLGTQRLESEGVEATSQRP